MNTIKFEDFPENPYAVEEALNRLAINIQFSSSETRKILVTSSEPGEGKSLVSFNLWRLLAQAGEKVVLVDADLRKSVLKDRYSFTSDGEIKGITYFLSGKSELKDAVYHTNFENADIMPVSNTIKNPITLINSKSFEYMLDALSEVYRYVIVDSAPLELVADGERIASVCDGYILVVRSGVTSKRIVKNSVNQLQRAGCPLLGMVLNRANTKGGKYYSKYGKYGDEKYGYYGK